MSSAFLAKPPAPAADTPLLVLDRVLAARRSSKRGGGHAVSAN